MPSQSFHHERIASQLLREIGWAIKNRLRDPRVPELVSVTHVKVSPDTRQATVLVSVFGSERTKQGALIALGRAAPYIQKLVAGRVHLRHSPKLTFKLDRSIDNAMHIEDLLEEVRDDLV